jgi:hypothetical protein
MSEKALLLAVIQQAVEDSKIDFIKIRDPTIREKAQQSKEIAIKWLHSNSKKEGSFCWYCWLLNLNPVWAKRKLGIM